MVNVLIYGQVFKNLIFEVYILFTHMIKESECAYAPKYAHTCEPA